MSVLFPLNFFARFVFLDLISHFLDSVLSGAGLSSGIGLSSIKLESPAYYCTSYTPPCSDPSLISSNYGSLSLARSHSPTAVAVSLADNSVIRVKRMRRMSSENEEELRGDKVSDLYYSQSPLGSATAWSQADLDQGNIGELRFHCTFRVIKYFHSPV